MAKLTKAQNKMLTESYKRDGIVCGCWRTKTVLKEKGLIEVGSVYKNRQGQFETVMTKAGIEYVIDAKLV